VAGVVRFVAWDGAQVAAGAGRQLALIVGVTAADVAAADEEMDAVAGMALFAVWHGAQVRARVGRAAADYCRSDGGGREAGRGGGAGGAVCRVRRRARCCWRGACGLCFLAACRWRVWRGLSRWTGCTLRLVFGVQSVLFVGLAVAGVVWFVPRDGVHVAACIWRAPGALCRRGGGGRGAGRGGGGGGAGFPERWLARSDASCVRGVVAALRVGTSRRTRHVTSTSG